MKKRNLSLWAVLFWLLVWQAGSMALHSDILLVSPLRVLPSLLGSMGRILGGFLLAAALGTLLAALAARFKRVEELLAPLVLAMKTVPVASFIILALIWFGSRNLSVFIALVMVFPVMYTNVLSGIRARDDSLLEMARVFKIPALRRIRCIDLACAGKRAWRRRSSACPCPPSASACSRRRSTLTRRSCLRGRWSSF